MHIAGDVFSILMLNPAKMDSEWTVRCLILIARYPYRDSIFLLMDLASLFFGHLYLCSKSDSTVCTKR